MFSRAGLRLPHGSDGCLGKQVALLLLPLGSLDSPGHLEVVCEGGLWNSTCPQSSTPSSECGLAWVLSNPETLH